MRGNRADMAGQPAGDGSIPASAGEPVSALAPSNQSQVYPRECGGTERNRFVVGWRRGLSPRVRGNPQHDCGNLLLPGSIPASAGEPAAATSGITRRSVYPRECGGTAALRLIRRVIRGLSPRVRGNLRGRSRSRLRRGSIPASAGEPGRSSLPTSERRVYPRECGGTDYLDV